MRLQGPALMYQWYKDERPIVRMMARQPDLEVRDCTLADCGSYHCTVVNSHGQARSRAATVQVTLAPHQATVSPGYLGRQLQRLDVGEGGDTQLPLGGPDSPGNGRGLGSPEGRRRRRAPRGTVDARMEAAGEYPMQAYGSGALDAALGGLSASSGAGTAGDGCSEGSTPTNHACVFYPGLLGVRRLKVLLDAPPAG